MADKLTPVRMLTALAGHAFSYAHGEIVQVEASIAKAWKAAGTAEDAPNALAAEKVAKDLGARIAELEALLADVTADRDAIKAQAETLGQQLAEATAALDAATKPAEAPAA